MRVYLPLVVYILQPPACRLRLDLGLDHSKGVGAEPASDTFDTFHFLWRGRWMPISIASVDSPSSFSIILTIVPW